MVAKERKASEKTTTETEQALQRDILRKDFAFLSYYSCGLYTRKFHKMNTNFLTATLLLFEALFLNKKMQNNMFCLSPMVYRDIYGAKPSLSSLLKGAHKAQIVDKFWV